MPRVRSPKRGSRSFSPRKRVKHFTGRVDHWPTVTEGPRLLGYAGYKAGMTHLHYIEDRRRVPEYGQEVKAAATVIDTPPMIICAIRVYKKTHMGLEAITEAWMADPPADFFRKVNQVHVSPERNLELIEKNLDKVTELRILAATQPRLTPLSRKAPDFMEIPIGGGSVEERFEYAKGLLGNTITVNDVFGPGESIDVVGVTKGKGFQGPVKRWGIRILQHKSRKLKRGVGSIGPWVPRRVMPQVPRAGQMGYHGRTEYNKRIMLMGDDGRVNKKSGIKNYGNVEGDYLLLKGSVMGPAKRMVKLRKAVRKFRHPEQAPQVTYLHSEWQKAGGE